MKTYTWLCLLVAAAGCKSQDAPTTVEAAAIVRAIGVGTSFDNATLGVPPDGWEVAETNGAGTPATWSVAADGDGKDANRCVRVAETRNHGATFNVLLSKSAIPADFELSIKVRADSGTEDQGGGLVWRASGPDDYYVARWNPLEQNLRTYKVVHGKRTMLSSVDVDGDAKGWHELAIRASGDEYLVSFDEKQVAIVDDATFMSDGRYGLWTKADAATSFDDLRVSWIDPTQP